MAEQVEGWLWPFRRARGSEHHSYFNGLRRTCAGIPDRVKRLKHMMAEHFQPLKIPLLGLLLKEERNNQRNKRLFTPFYPLATSFSPHSYILPFICCVRLSHSSGEKEEQHSNNSNSSPACSENVR